MPMIDHALARWPHLDLSQDVTEMTPSPVAYGGYADVFTGYSKKHAKKVAIKRIRIHISGDEKLLKRIKKEMYIWSRLLHPNVLPILGFIIDRGGERPSFVSEWMVKGSLRTYMKQLLPWDVYKIVLGIAIGLDFLHSKGIIHCDLKAANVLISETGDSLLTDFGVSSILESSLTLQASDSNAIRGSTRWLAPDLLNASPSGEYQKNTVETDVWAFGMTTYEVLTRQSPYHHIRLDFQVVLAICRNELPLPPSCPWFTSLQGLGTSLLAICHRCWSERKERSTMRQVIQELTVVTSRANQKLADSPGSVLGLAEVPGQVCITSDSASPDLKRTGLALLESVLRELPHLKLTGKVDDFEKERVWIHGRYAVIRKGHVAETPKYVAVKEVVSIPESIENDAKRLAKEIRIWSELDHPNVLPLLGYIPEIETGLSFPISEWVEGGLLIDRLTDLTRSEAIFMALGIAKGLAYLHSKKVIHANLTTVSVLVSSQKQALLTGFDISWMESLGSEYSPGPDSQMGSIRWMAYELCAFDSDEDVPLHTKETDIWAFGMTLYGLLSYEVPYSSIKRNTQVPLAISRRQLPIRPKHLDSSTGLDKFIENRLWKICNKCWNLEPSKRPKISTIVAELEDIAEDL